MANSTARVIFTPSGRRGDIAQGTSVLEAARNLGVDLDSVCGGRGLCGRCQVTCVEGDFAKHGIVSHANHLSKPGDAERDYAARRHPLVDGRRLGCQAIVLGDLVIDVPAESQIHRQVVRKNADHRDIALDTSVRLHYIDVQEPHLEDPSGDLQRVSQALAALWQLPDLEFDSAMLPQLQRVLREGSWRITVAVRERTTVIAAWPGLKREAYGVAIDIGSTTIAAHLCNLMTGEVAATRGTMNPQIRFGEDLMSRVSYVTMHPEGSAELTQTVRTGINALIAGVTQDAGIEPGDILEATVTGNPVMHHLFLGISPVELGWAPFALATDSALNLKARELDMSINAGGVVYVLPCIAGHVGADAAAMILAEEPHRLQETTLLVDVGTNAEIVLGNCERLLACSSPTGPAFEGAQISCGQRAAPGAIERVRIDANTLEARFKVIGSDFWSDHAGFAESVTTFGVTGICGSGIIEAIAEMYLAGLVTEEGVIDGDLASKTPRLVPDERTWSFLLHNGSPGICITQNDVRQIQLAKGALYAGARLLMDKAGLEHVDRIRLAGAFGSHIDPRYAMILGLIPDCDLSKVGSAGNAAGTGARIALLNSAARTEIEAVVRRVEKIETAVEARFQAYFVDAMAIPHKSDPFTHLFSTIDKPAVKKNTTRNKSGRRRKRAS